MENQKKKFNMADRAKSFSYAFKGIAEVIKSEHNAWIHLMVALVAIVLGLIFHISKHEWIAVILCIGFVLTCETINSALEKLVDYVSPEKRPQAGLIKDMAAGAVLIASVTALIVGLIIFLPNFAKLF